MKARVTFSVLLMVGLFLALLLGLSALAPVQAASGTLFVAPNGTGTVCTQARPCPLQTALARSQDGDTIYLAGGTYTGTGPEVVRITKSITLYGGWDGAPTGPVVRNPDAHPTVLDGEGQRRVVYISGDITPTLDGFIITRGNATGLTDDCEGSAGNPDGCGGGIFVYQAHPIIVNNVITGNVAAITTAGYPTGTIGYGGGIYLYLAHRAAISGNTVISNVGSLANAGCGGGISIYKSSDVLVYANRVLSNTATTGPGMGWGGGIALAHSSGSVGENEIVGNWTRRGYGSALYQWFGSGTFRRNRITGNHGGDAVYLGYSEASFEGNQVVENATSNGVYLKYGNPGHPTLVNNVVAGSRRSVKVSASPSSPLTATLLHNTLVGTGDGNGVWVTSEHVTLTLVNNIVVSHTVGVTTTEPGASISADHTLFWANDDDGIRGTNPVDGDPRFVNPAAGNYHIGPGSAAIDAGVDAGVTTDIDGQPRPFGPAPDIGADEYVPKGSRFYLPVMYR